VAVEVENGALFMDYVDWAASLFAGLGKPASFFASTLAAIRTVIGERLDLDVATACDVRIEEALGRLERTARPPASFVEEPTPLADLARRYMDALRRRDQHTAQEVILQAVEDGADIRDIYMEVFQPVLYELGRLWQTNKISVGQEHYATAATQLVMSQLYPRIFSACRNGLRLVSVCVGGELHEIGARMVTDFFEMEGWDTHFYGASTPSESVVEAVREIEPHVLGISATIAVRLHKVTDLIQRAREDPTGRHAKILVGGYPFNHAPGLWKQVGADGYGRDAKQAVAIAVRLVGITPS
jgi:methanogenic corrinoid protein MtbC1